MKKTLVAVFAIGVGICGAIGSAQADIVLPDYDFSSAYSNDSVNIELSGLANFNKAWVSFDLYILDSWDGTYGKNGERDSPDVFGITVNGLRQEWTFDNFKATCESLGTCANITDRTFAETNPDQSYTLGYFNSIDNWTPDREFINYNEGFAFDFSTAGPLNFLDLSFYGYGLQGAADESWTIKNLKVWTDHLQTIVIGPPDYLLPPLSPIVVEPSVGPAPVPEPATMLLLGTGLAGLAAVRRNKKS